MYGKLFSSMYEGTLYGQWQGIITLQQLVILADADGVVDMTPPAIASRTSIPLEIIETGLEQLSQADKYSRSKADEGRRIVLLDPDRPWGWQIVNYRYYRDLASREDKKRKDRERIAKKRKENSNVAGRRKVSQGVAERREVSQGVANVAHTDTDTDTDINTKNPPLPPSRGEQPKKQLASSVDNLDDTAWQEWIEYRRAKKLRAYKTNRQAKWLAKYPADVQRKIVELSIRQEYQGLFEPKHGPNGDGRKSMNEIRDNLARLMQEETERHERSEPRRLGHAEETGPEHLGGDDGDVWSDLD